MHISSPESLPPLSSGVAVSHPTGNANVRAVLETLLDAGRLDRFFTGFGISTHSNFHPLKRALAQRAFPIPASKIKNVSIREFARTLSLRMGSTFFLSHETGLLSVDRVYHDIDAATSRYLEKTRTPPHALYCYEDGALRSFQTSEKLGIRRIYDLPIAYWQTAHNLLAEERMRYPKWSPTLKGIGDSRGKLDRKVEEISRADVVVCPSQFVLDSLPAEVRERSDCAVARFGCPSVPSGLKRGAENEASPLRVLFVGSMTQRKGLADLFAAFKMMQRRDVTLVILGSTAMGMDVYRGEGVDFEYHPPCSHGDVLRLMHECDVFALPSIVEGRALVQLEALACGLPLIITPNTGGEDLLLDERTGFMVPIRDPEKIASRIAWFADNRSRLPEMREACYNKARETNWGTYKDEILKIVAASAR